MDPLVLGVDVGGTASRAVVTAIDGEVVGRGRAGGGNPNTVGLDRAVSQVAAAARAALAGLDPARVRAAVMGIAGTCDFGASEIGAAFRRAWDGLGLTCPVRPVGDIEVAYAAGTDASAGTVVIAGTGAIAARIEDGRPSLVNDGLGWLLGDRGSGFWIGRTAATRAAEDLQSGREPTALTRAIAETLTGRADPTDDEFAAAVYRRPPVELAGLAPLVDSLAESGDGPAASILDSAGRLLVATVDRVRNDGESGPIVMAGSVLRQSRRVRTGLEAALAERWPNAPILLGGPGEEGAARMAARSLDR